jgi:hypothetical protein
MYGSGSTTLGKSFLLWQEEPADSWEETLEVKDSWEMEEETAKVIKIIKPRISGSIVVVDPHFPDLAFFLIADLDPGSQTNADPCGWILGKLGVFRH